MKTKRIPVLELIIFCIIMIVFIIAGYFYFLNVSMVDRTTDWPSISFSTIFLIALLSILLFFRKTLLNMNKLIEEKFELQQTYLKRLNNTYEGTLKALSYALDLRDHETWGHSARVVGYALAIAEKMGLEGNELRQLAWAGFLHDIGKIGVPDAILLKKTTLEPEEWENIKRHPQIGYEAIREIDFLKFAADIVLSHHEHYDGTGYPGGLTGESIPLGARIFAIADTMDAMTSSRPYRAAIKMKTALEEIKKLSGKQFCPRCVAVMEELGIDHFQQIQQQVKQISDVTSLRNGLDPLLSFAKIE